MLPILAAAALTISSIKLPGGRPVAIDYLARDAAYHRVWVPAGNTGNVDVLDTQTGKVTAIGGFKTRPSDRPGRPPMGPSSAAVGEGVVWIGNRGENAVCEIDEATLKERECIPLPAMPDGLLWIPETQELWVTTPRTHSITIVSPERKGRDRISTLVLEGDPEGFAVHGGTFFTNLEDKDRTLLINVHTREVAQTLRPNCGAKGPRGLVVSPDGKVLVVACTDGAVGFALGGDKPAMPSPNRLTTSPGVDAIDMLAAKSLVYVPSGSDGTLTIACVSTDGSITTESKASTAKGVRSVVVDSEGIVYGADSQGGRILMMKTDAASK